MKLFEIRPELPQSHRIVDIPMLKGASTIGTGAQGYVQSLKTKPNKVVKIALMVDNDAYEQFIRVVSKYQNNPYFPIIYSVKKYPINKMSPQDHIDLISKVHGDPDNYKYSQGMLDQIKWVVVVVMERLFPVIGPISQVIYKQLLKLYGSIGQEMYNKKESLNQLFWILNDPIELTKVLRSTPDPQFKNALRLLRPLLSNIRHMSDMRRDNIMYRKIGNVPQIVFVDPIWNNFSETKKG